MSHAGRGVSFSFVKKTGMSSLAVPRLAVLVVGVLSPLTELFCLSGEGVDNSAWEDWVWRRDGVHENLGILEGDVSLTGERDGRCLMEDLGPEVLRCLGVRESSANALTRDELRDGGPFVASCCELPCKCCPELPLPLPLVEELRI